MSPGIWIEEAPGIFFGMPRNDIDENTFNIRAKLSRAPFSTRLTHRFNTFTDWPGTGPALASAKEFVFHYPQHHFLTFAGPSGTGKTHLSLAILWNFIECGLGAACYVQVTSLLDILCAQLDFDDKANRQAQSSLGEYILKCPLLIMDDVKQVDTLYTRGAKLDSIVDHRYINQLRTVFTTNDKPDQLSPRLVDRLYEGVLVVIKAASYRKEKGKGVNN